jgi:hypothetical protein
MALKLTLGTGEEIVVPFDSTSAITITTVQVVEGVQVEKAEAHADVVGIELVDDPIVETPEPVTMTPDEAAAAGNVNPDSGVEPGTEPPVAEPGADQTPPAEIVHDDAVAAAQDAVVAATTGGATIDHVTQAIADVNAALAVYPDSAELADAKFQLESAAGITAGA